MKTIWKFPIAITDDQFIEMPKTASILTCQMQFGCPVVWALVETDSEMTKRNLVVLGTGNPCPDDVEELAYVSTIQQHGGSLVWHVFERFL